MSHWTLKGCQVLVTERIFGCVLQRFRNLTKRRSVKIHSVTIAPHELLNYMLQMTL